ARDARTDVAYAASYLRQSTSRPTERSLRRLKREFGYLQANPMSVAIPMVYKGGELDIRVFFDASMGNNNDPYGTTGWLVFVNNHLVAWRSKKQARVSRSSTTAELISIHDAVDYLSFLLRTYKACGIKANVNLLTDSNDLACLLNSR